MYEQITEHMKKLGYKDHWIRYTLEWVYELQQSGVYCLDRFIRKLLATRDKVSCSDIIAEGRVALILARNAFSEVAFIKEERNRRLPDLKAIWNKNTVYFEVTRRHPAIDEWADDFDINKLSPDRTENVISKIKDKIRQLKIGGVNIVVLWSDTWALDLPNVEEAFEYIKQEINQNPRAYKKLSGVLFTTGAVSSGTLKQFRIFENNKASKPLGIRLAKKLESLYEEDHKKSQKYFEALARALRSKGDR